MGLPPLYKYLNVHGAKLTLGNRTFRHAKPSDFNDIEDMTAQSLFADDINVALEKVSEGHLDVVLARLNDPPTCASPMREELVAIQQAFRSNPKSVDLVRAELMKD